uniref:Uncharacterized protein n=1 Tax=Rhizophora mucronata TaxID=61149 RepID=A0A2P2J970_RHIMU
MESCVHRAHILEQIIYTALFLHGSCPQTCKYISRKFSYIRQKKKHSKLIA